MHDHWASYQSKIANPKSKIAGGAMYFFVRFTGIVILVCGVVLMLLGFGGAIYAFVQNIALTDLVNQYVFEASQSSLRVTDTRFFSSVAGLMVFTLGMGTAAVGQLMLIFADIATNTRETNVLLRGMRRVELAAPARTAREAESDRMGLAAPVKPAREVDLEQIEFIQTVKPQPQKQQPQKQIPGTLRPLQTPWEPDDSAFAARDINQDDNRPRG
jgi:hypothetical protein